MSVEDILPAARKANGEIIDKRSAPPALKSPSPKYDAPQKWYEKKWGVGLLLITCFPLGVILLWQNPRYSNQMKGSITAGIICLILFYYYSTYEPPTRRQEPYYTQSSSYSSSYDVGYLRKGSMWIDENGNSHYTSKDVKVEIWRDNQIVTADGGKLTQIYFLEGYWAGSWGYINR